MTNAVKTERKDYAKAKPDWDLVTTVVAGERAVKARKEKYLPMPNPLDSSEANVKRFEQYLARAVFYNATGRTERGLVGSVFGKAPEMSVPTVLDYLSKDADGSGVGIHQQAQSVLRGVLRCGRHALLVDYPKTEGAASAYEQQTGGLRATIMSYPAEAVINWRTEVVGAVRRLSLVVIKEARDVSSNEFEAKSEDRYRVLKLVGGVYTVEIWEKSGEGLTLASSHTPKNGASQTWSFIPFTFVGANNNDPEVDSAPLLDLATLNLAHYRNSADYEDSIFFSGQPQPWMAGLTTEWRDWLHKEKVYVGSRTVIPLPEKGSFGFAQAQPNTLAKEGMDQKEKQMSTLGARLVQRGGAQRTATEAEDDNEAEHSVLSLAAENVSEAYTMALKWAAAFMLNTGKPTEEELYQLNTDFAVHSLDPQLITAVIAAWQAGKVPASDVWAQFRKWGLIDPEKTDEQLKDELEGEHPSGGMGDALTGALGGGDEDGGE